MRASLSPRFTLAAALALSATLLATLASCSSSGGGDETPAAPAPCTPGGDGGYRSDLYPKLSDYCMVRIEGGEVVAERGVVPYDLNAPLFSDYAQKRRTVWLPPGTQVAYAAEGRLEFPEGTIITKSFGFAPDLRKPDEGIRWVETRVMAKGKGGWQAASYLWDDAQREATLKKGGKLVDVSWVDGEGQDVSTRYLVPQATQCIKCHADVDRVVTIGPTARQLNRDYPYGDGAENQLARWSRLGWLSGAPSPGDAPKLASWADASQSAETRGRSYLESNCAHCHSETGDARTSGLVLLSSETDPYKLGVCKPPVAAGQASGDLLYDIVPGKPDESIVIRRMLSTTPQIAMPELGRSVVHKEGVEVLRAWIEGLPGGCGGAAPLPAGNGRGRGSPPLPAGSGKGRGPLRYQQEAGKGEGPPPSTAGSGRAP